MDSGRTWERLTMAREVGYWTVSVQTDSLMGEVLVRDGVSDAEPQETESDSFEDAVPFPSIGRCWRDLGLASLCLRMRDCKSARLVVCAAYHEAGHTVVPARLGLQLKEAGVHIDSAKCRSDRSGGEARILASVNCRLLPFSVVYILL